MVESTPLKNSSLVTLDESRSFPLPGGTRGAQALLDRLSEDRCARRPLGGPSDGAWRLCGAHACSCLRARVFRRGQERFLPPSSSISVTTVQIRAPHRQNERPGKALCRKRESFVRSEERR